MYVPLCLYTCWSIPSYAPKQRGEELKKIIKSVRDGTFEYNNKEPVKTDWAQYDQAQIYEMVNYLNNIRDLVDLANKRINERRPENGGLVDRQLILPTLQKLYCCKRTNRHSKM